MSEWYRLDDNKQPVPCSLLEGAEFMEISNRRVALDEIDGVRISTVFLGLDHAFGGAVPILFETMIFGGRHDQYQRRYSTWEEAEAGHAEIKKAIESGEALK